MRELMLGVLTVLAPACLAARDFEVPQAVGREVAAVYATDHDIPWVPSFPLPARVDLKPSTDGYAMEVEGRGAGSVVLKGDLVMIKDKQGTLIASARLETLSQTMRSAPVRDSFGSFLGEVLEVIPMSGSASSKTRIFAITSSARRPAAGGYVEDRQFELRGLGTRKGPMGSYDGPVAVSVKREGEGLSVETLSVEVDRAAAIVAAVLNNQSLDLIERMNLNLNLPRRGPQGMDRGR